MASGKPLLAIRNSPFAIRQTSGLLDLRVFELDGRGATEDRDRHFQAGAVLVDLLDDAVEGGEGTVGDADLLADLEMDRRLRMLDALRDLALDALGLGIRDRHRLRLVGPEEARDLRGVLDEVV